MAKNGNGDKIAVLWSFCMKFAHNTYFGSRKLKILQKVFLNHFWASAGESNFLKIWLISGSPGALLRRGSFFIFVLFDSTSLPCCNEGLITSLWRFFVKLWSFQWRSCFTTILTIFWQLWRHNDVKNNFLQKNFENSKNSHRGACFKTKTKFLA